MTGDRFSHDDIVLLYIAVAARIRDAGRILAISESNDYITTTWTQHRDRLIALRDRLDAMIDDTPDN